MPKHTTKNQARGHVLQEIYDFLMSAIEPELTTTMLPQLDRLYANETEEERTARAARYAEAFELCTEQFALIGDLWKEELLVFKTEAIARCKREAAGEEKQQLSDIEHSLDAQ